MPGPGLALATSPYITATCDECHRDDDGEDGRKAGAEASPVYVDIGKAMVGLVQGDIGGFVIDLVGDREVCFIMEHERWGLRGGGGRSPFPFGETFILESNLLVH